MESAIKIKIEPIKNHETAQLIYFSGDLDATNVDEVLQYVMDLYGKGVAHLVINCAELRYVNSTGLGILLHLSKGARELGGCFKLATVNENVYEIIEIIGATTLLEIYDTVNEAVASLK